MILIKIYFWPLFIKYPYYFNK